MEEIEIDRIELTQEERNIDIDNINLLTSRLVIWDYEAESDTQFALTEDLIFYKGDKVIKLSELLINSTFIFKETQCVIEDEGTPELEYRINLYLGQDLGNLNELMN